MKKIKFIALAAAAFIVTSCTFFNRDEASYVHEDGLLLNDDLVAIKSSDGKISIRNTATGKVTIKDIEIEWTTPSPHDSLAVFCSEGKRGYYNIYTGEIAVPAMYRRAWVFSEGMAAVQKNGNIGFIGHNGETIIDFRFPYHGNPLTDFVFDEGHCVMADENGKCGVIDREGTWLIPAEYDNVSAYSEYAIGTKEGCARQVGYDGRIINNFVLDDIRELTYTEEETCRTGNGEICTYERTVKTGLFAYCIGGRYGLMDGESCTRLTEPLYKGIYAVSGKMFVAELLDYSSEVILNEKGDVMQ